MENGTEFTWTQLQDGRSARLALTTEELRTAFCGDEAYADVDRLPDCRALDNPPCL